MFITKGFMKPAVTTPERWAEIHAHWDKVRDGLHEPEPHDYTNDVSGLIAMKWFQAGVAIKRAAELMLEVYELSDAAIDTTPHLSIYASQTTRGGYNNDRF